MGARGAAGWILIALGVAHGGGMVRDLFAPAFFVPTDGATFDAIRNAPVAVATWFGARMTIWDAHVGWNLSFALGFVFLGALQLRLARIDRDGSRGRALEVASFVAVGCIAILAASRWFWVPFAGIAAATIALGFAVRTRSPKNDRKDDRAEAPRTPPSADGAWIFLGAAGIGLAGALHLVGSIVDAVRPWAYAPTDAAVLRAMQDTIIALPARFGVSRSFWQAYSGFSAAHGVVVTAYAVVAWLVGRRLDGRIGGDRVVRALFAAASIAWFAIGARFWFSGPAIVTALAATCHVVALVRAKGLPPITPPPRSST
jgi:hypothetical protein